LQSLFRAEAAGENGGTRGHKASDWNSAKSREIPLRFDRRSREIIPRNYLWRGRIIVQGSVQYSRHVDFVHFTYILRTNTKCTVDLSGSVSVSCRYIVRRLTPLKSSWRAGAERQKKQAGGRTEECLMSE